MLEQMQQKFRILGTNLLFMEHQNHTCIFWVVGCKRYSSLTNHNKRILYFIHNLILMSYLYYYWILVLGWQNWYHDSNSSANQNTHVPGWFLFHSNTWGPCSINLEPSWIWKAIIWNPNAWLRILVEVNILQIATNLEICVSRLYVFIF